MAAPLLGIPLWAWIVGGGGAAVGGAYVAGNAAEKVGTAADSVTKAVLVVGGAYIAYRAYGALK